MSRRASLFPSLSRAAVLGVLPCSVCVALACNALSSAPSPDADGSLRPLDDKVIGDAAADAWIDCVGVLHVVALRGGLVANAQRFGEDAAALRTTARLADLSPIELRAFCDWEACIRANGYGHACALDDAGFETCHVCSGAADCDGRPMNQDECVAHAADPGRAPCHVGLLQECLLQQALRGPAFSCVTETCRQSDRACAGALPGDLSAQAIAAQRETDQVTIEELKDEVAFESNFDPDAEVVHAWGADADGVLNSERTLSLWDGGSSSCAVVDAGDAGAALDAEAGD